MRAAGGSRRLARALRRNVLAAAFVLLPAAPALATPPIADAGPDKDVRVDSSVLLWGSATDPDLDPIVGYAWVVESSPVGGTAYLSTPTSSTTNFFADTPGIYIVSFRAWDSFEVSEKDYVNVTVYEIVPPDAVASVDVTIGFAPLTVHFDGSASSVDPHTTPLTYAWSFGDGEIGSGVSPTHTYTQSGWYIAQLAVLDRIGQTDLDTVEITVGSPAECWLIDPATLVGANFNHPAVGTSNPHTFTILNACGATDIEIGAIFLAAGSHPDFSITAAPSLPHTLGAGLSADVEVTFAPTEPYFRDATLVIQSNDSIRPEISIPMVSHSNHEPIADAGPDRDIAARELIVLQGSATDPDFDPILDWLWTVESSPPGSAPWFSDPTRPDPQFYADLPGDYILFLIAADTWLDWSRPDFVTVHVTTPPAPAFKIDSSVFNAGGHPDDATILTSSNFQMSLDALGDAAGAVALGSASWRMEAGLTPGYGPPGEVMNLRFDDATTLRWDAEPTAGLYNLYDADTCVPPALTQTMTTIAADPAPGEMFLFLVTAENGLGEEGTRGYKSDHSERLNPTPCP